MRFTSLTNEEKTATGGFTHRLDFSFRDIPPGIAVATLFTFSTPPLPRFNVGDIITDSICHLTVPFQNTADAAFNSDTFSVGLVTGGVAALQAAVEVNKNGAFVPDTIPGVGTPVVPFKNVTALNQMTLTLNSMAAKSISNLNAGQLFVLFAVLSPYGQSISKAVPFGSGYT
jgi:hypothetical protein